MHRHWKAFGACAAIAGGLAVVAPAAAADRSVSIDPNKSYTASAGCVPGNPPALRLTNTGTGDLWLLWEPAPSGPGFGPLLAGTSQDIPYAGPGAWALLAWELDDGVNIQDRPVVASGDFSEVEPCLETEPTSPPTTSPPTTTTATTTTTSPSTTTTSTPTPTSTTSTTMAPAPSVCPGGVPTPAPGEPILHLSFRRSPRLSPGRSGVAQAEPCPAPPAPPSTTTTSPIPDPSPVDTSPEATDPPAIDVPAVSTSTSSATAGERVTASASGFQPGEQVGVVLHSTPRSLGTVSADDGGVATVTFTILDDDEVGMHEIVFTGAVSGTVSVSLQIVGATLPMTR
jgi:hypothetical protein